MKLNFNLRNSSGKEKTTINLIINYDKKRFKYQLNNPLGISYKIHPHNWNFKIKRPKAKGQIRPISEVNNIELINDVINELNYKLPIQINKHLQEYSTIDNIALKTMCDDILNMDSISDNSDVGEIGEVYSYLSNLIVDMESGKKLTRGGVRYSIGTIKQYRNLRDRLQEYNKEIKFNDIDKDFFNSFIYYLNDNNYAISTVGKFIKDLRSMMGIADDDGVSNNKVHLERWFVPPRQNSDLNERTDVMLTAEEVDKLYNCNFSEEDEYLEKYRDLFMIGVFSGLRVSDYLSINKEKIKKDKDGYYIRLLTHKDKKSIYVPIIDNRLLELLVKYDFNPPAVQPQKLNDYIKVICKNLEIDEMIIYQEEKGGRVVELTAEKWELITTHTARRTFITQKLLNGWSKEEIIQFTGHSDIKMLDKYDKSTQRQKQLSIINKRTLI